MNKKSKILLCGLVLAACAHASVRYYGILWPTTNNISDVELEEVDGPDGTVKIPLTDCKPTSANPSTCTLQKTQDFFNLLKDDQDCHVQLSACQKSCTP